MPIELLEVEVLSDPLSPDQTQVPTPGRDVVAQSLQMRELQAREIPVERCLPGICAHAGSEGNRSIRVFSKVSDRLVAGQYPTDIQQDQAGDFAPSAPLRAIELERLADTKIVDELRQDDRAGIAQRKRPGLQAFEQLREVGIDLAGDLELPRFGCLLGRAQKCRWLLGLLLSPKPTQPHRRPILLQKPPKAQDLVDDRARAFQSHACNQFVQAEARMLELLLHDPQLQILGDLVPAAPPLPPIDQPPRAIQ